MSDSVRPHRRQPTRLPRPWDSPGKNTGVGCHLLLQCMKVKSESVVARLCPTFSDPMNYSLPGSSIHGILQARVLEWVANRCLQTFLTCNLHHNPTHTHGYMSIYMCVYVYTHSPETNVLPKMSTLTLSVLFQTFFFCQFQVSKKNWQEGTGIFHMPSPHV